MPLKRYTITLVKPGTADRPTLLVPFEPSAIVISLIEELFRRIKKQGLAFDTGTHICTLTIDSEDGKLVLLICYAATVLTHVFRRND